MATFKVEYKDGSSEEIAADVADFRGDLLVFFRRVTLETSQHSDSRKDALSVITTRPASSVASVEETSTIAW